MTSYLSGLLRSKAPPQLEELEEPEFSLEELIEKADFEVANNRVPPEFLNVVKVTTTMQDWAEFKKENPGVALAKPQQFYLQNTLSKMKNVVNQYEEELQEDANHPGLKAKISGEIVATVQVGNSTKRFQAGAYTELRSIFFALNQHGDLCARNPTNGVKAPFFPHDSENLNAVLFYLCKKLDDQGISGRNPLRDGILKSVGLNITHVVDHYASFFAKHVRHLPAALAALAAATTGPAARTPTLYLHRGNPHPPALSSHDQDDENAKPSGDAGTTPPHVLRQRAVESAAKLRLEEKKRRKAEGELQEEQKKVGLLSEAQLNLSQAELNHSEAAKESHTAQRLQAEAANKQADAANKQADAASKQADAAKTTAETHKQNSASQLALYREMIASTARKSGGLKSGGDAFDLVDDSDEEVGLKETSRAAPSKRSGTTVSTVASAAPKSVAHKSSARKSGGGLKSGAALKIVAVDQDSDDEEEYGRRKATSKTSNAPAIIESTPAKAAVTPASRGQKTAKTPGVKTSTKTPGVKTSTKTPGVKTAAKIAKTPGVKTAAKKTSVASKKTASTVAATPSRRATKPAASSTTKAAGRHKELFVGKPVKITGGEHFYGPSYNGDVTFGTVANKFTKSNSRNIPVIVDGKEGVHLIDIKHLKLD